MLHCYCDKQIKLCIQWNINHIHILGIIGDRMELFELGNQYSNNVHWKLRQNIFIAAITNLKWNFFDLSKITITVFHRL